MHIKHYLYPLFTLLFFLTLTPAKAEKVQIKLSDKITANAEFLLGEQGKPSIVVLHGFLLTNNFHTVKRLAESLNELGYSVLSPTLSLGINKRKKSLSCEAVHSHSVETDINEVGQWVTWLEEKTKEKIILIGHSTGSIHLVYYLSRNPQKKIKHLLLLSLPNFAPSSFSKETLEYQMKAKSLVEKGDKSLQTFGLSYCNKYPTSAENYLSYYQLSKANIAKALANITANTTLIIGSKDQRVDRQWNQNLSQYNVHTIKIKGANHFFDNEFEFDLLNNVEEIIEKIN